MNEQEIQRAKEIFQAQYPDMRVTVDRWGPLPGEDDEIVNLSAWYDGADDPAYVVEARDVVDPSASVPHLFLSRDDIRALLPLCRRKLANMERRYENPRQVARRAELAAEGKRDAAIHAIERMRDLVSRFEKASS